MISYEELSLVFDMDNPLTLEYFEICDKHTDEDFCFDRHHILPESMFKTYSKCKWNLVKLAYKDHYRVHEILPFICLQQEHKNKMINAWNRIYHSKSENNISPERYAVLKKLHKEANSGVNHPQYGKKFSPERLKKHAEIRRGKKLTPMSEETRAKRNTIRKGVKHSEESKQRRSEASKGEKNPFFGKKHTSESRAQMSINLSGENHPQFGKPIAEHIKTAISEANSLPYSEFVNKLSMKDMCLVGAYTNLNTLTTFQCDQQHPSVERKPIIILKAKEPCPYCRITKVHGKLVWEFKREHPELLSIALDRLSELQKTITNCRLLSDNIETFTSLSERLGVKFETLQYHEVAALKKLDKILTELASQQVTNND